jgi:hypothetical protein
MASLSQICEFSTAKTRQAGAFTTRPISSKMAPFMAQYLDRAAAIVFGLLIAWGGRWMFFHPERTLKKIYGDLMSPSRFSKVFFRIFATMWVVIGLSTACEACVSDRLWAKYAFQVMVSLAPVVAVCTFLLLRRGLFPRLTQNPKP